jgi:hypothetical protein
MTGQDLEPSPLPAGILAIHAVGHGSFIVDGRRMDRSRQMAGKLPAGL